MKKIFLFLVISIFLFSFIIAEESGGTLIGKQGECISLPQECASCSYVNITSIQYPNMSRIYINEEMNKQGVSYDYEFCNTTELGSYVYCMVGDVDGIDTSVCKDFEISYFGKELSSAQATIYIALLGILFFILFSCFYGMTYLPNSNEKDEWGRILSVSYLKYLRLPIWLFIYFLFAAIIFLSSNIAYAFLSERMFGDLLHSIFRILLGFSPIVIILLMINFFVKFFHDKEFQRMLNRGMFPGGNL